MDILNFLKLKHDLSSLISEILELDKDDDFIASEKAIAEYEKDYPRVVGFKPSVDVPYRDCVAKLQKIADKIAKTITELHNKDNELLSKYVADDIKIALDEVNKHYRRLYIWKRHL